MTIERLPELIPYRKKDKWGYCDKDKLIVIPPIFDRVYKYNNGIGKVCNNFKYIDLFKVPAYHPTSIYGFIDKDGVITDLIFIKASDFQDGLASVQLYNFFDLKYYNHEQELWVDYPPYSEDDIRLQSKIVNTGKFGFIDKKGEVIIPFIYDEASDFRDGFAEVRKAGRLIKIDKNGNEILVSDRLDPKDLSDGLILQIKEDSPWVFTCGFVDIDNNVIIPFIYTKADKFSEGLACVWCTSNYGYGYIDNRGEVIIDFQYEIASSFSEGLASVKKDRKSGYIDKQGNTVIPFIYDNAYSFCCGIAKVRISGKYGYIDKLGNEITSISYDVAGDFCHEVSGFFYGIAQVRLSNKYGYVNESGIEIISTSYDEVIGKFGTKHNTCLFKKNNKYGAININGEQIIDFIYDELEGDFEDDKTVCFLKINGKWGGLNYQGEKVLPFMYDRIVKLKEQIYFSVMQDNKWGIIDNTGYMFIKNIYDSIGCLSENYISVEVSKKWGFVDLKGDMKINCKYDRVDSFTDGIAGVYASNQLLGFIDKQGTEYWEQ